MSVTFSCAPADAEHVVVDDPDMPNTNMANASAGRLLDTLGYDADRELIGAAPGDEFLARCRAARTQVTNLESSEARCLLMATRVAQEAADMGWEVVWA